MSWFARSIVSSLKPEDEHHPVNETTDVSRQLDQDNSPISPGRGVKEDLSEITKTLTRQFWGVASFLSPPIPTGHSNERPESSDSEISAPEPISGIRRDFAEIGGRFRTGISKLSNNIDVSEITKMASNFLQLESEDEDNDSTDVDGDGAVGVTDEVVAFARDIAMHPETWLDFPLPKDEDDDEEFDLSDAQQEHALAVERLAPRLGALRIELCPGYMSESSFWKIYFVLLHPRLDRRAAEILSTPEIVKARASLTHELKNRSMNEAPRSKSYSENSSDSTAPGDNRFVPSITRTESVPREVSANETSTVTVSGNAESIKHAIHTHDDELEVVDKSVIKEEPPKGKDESDADDWLKDENSEEVVTDIRIENDEDVSFSDLEDDDGNIPIHYKKATHGSDSSRKESRGWVELGNDSCANESGEVRVHNSEAKESNDWLDVVDIDVA